MPSSRSSRRSTTDISSPNSDALEPPLWRGAPVAALISVPGTNLFLDTGRASVAAADNSCPVPHRRPYP